MDITYKGFIYFIERNEMENDKSLFQRSMFLAKQRPLNEVDYKKNLKISNIWINKKMLKCRYSENIEKILNEKDDIYRS